MLAGARYSIGYGKLMVGGLGGVLHFEPQAFVAPAVCTSTTATSGPSADAGLGLLVFLTPKLFTRIDTSLVFEREQRSGNRGLRVGHPAVARRREARCDSARDGVAALVAVVGVAAASALRGARSSGDGARAPRSARPGRRRRPATSCCVATGDAVWRGDLDDRARRR